MSVKLPGLLFLFLFLFFFDGFCFLCQLNCPDLCFCFFLWVLFSVLVKLSGPLFLFCFFFFLLGFVFCVILTGRSFFFFLMGFVFYVN